jgi:hypothetical protein
MTLQESKHLESVAANVTEQDALSLRLGCPRNLSYQGWFAADGRD